MELSPSPLPRMELDWTVGPSEGADAEPERRVSATVPGAVQLDWARANAYPPPEYGTEAERYIGLENFWWHYRSTIPALPPEGTHRLLLKDIDHHALVRIDGQPVAQGGGIGRVLRIPLRPEEGGRILDVVVSPAPKVPGEQGRGRARATTKAAVSYGWDFHPDLIPLGIAGGAWVETLPEDFLESVSWRDRLSPDLSRAEVRVSVVCVGEGCCVLELRDPDGRPVFRTERPGECTATLEFHFEVENPQLWWPLGQGSQHLYTLAVSFGPTGVPPHSITRRIGFRRARLVMAPGQWDEPSAFPKSRSLPPMNVEINGRRIFAKGANIVGPDLFPGTVGPSRWQDVVRRAAAAGMNLLRVWGGAPPPDDAFFDACDEAGIMVIQEFPLACNAYPDDPAYLGELEQAAGTLLQRLSTHPCRILWSGGNELFNAWSGMTDQSHALRLLAALAWREDPDTPFVPTLPVEGLGHGYYLFRDPVSGQESFQLFQQARNTGYTEFGVPGAASEERIRAIIPAEELWPPRPSKAWKLHSGMEAWDVEPTSYLCISTIEHYWGPQPNLRALVEKSQWLQCEGHKAIIEEARRQRPYCGWALLWCLNEPWPTVANQCLLAYPDDPKPAYESVRQAMRATLASARIPKFQWQAGELFEADIGILHDAPVPRPEVVVEIRLASGGWSETILTWVAAAGPANTDLPGPTVRCRLPDALGADLTVELRTAPPDLASQYRLATRQTVGTAGEEGQPRGLNV